MAGAKLISYEGPRNVLMWKSEVTEFTSSSKLVVQESQEAVLFRDGLALDTFGPGQHQLLTENIPLLKKIYEKLTRNPSVYQCGIYYINKTISEEMLWGTNSAIQLEDPRYGILINVRSFGSYKIQVADSRKFLVKMVGSLSSFTKDSIQDYFRTEMISRVKTELAKAIAYQGISILEINAHLDDLSSLVKKGLLEVFTEYGLMLKQFLISNIKATDEDLAKLKKIKEANIETIIDAKSRKQAMEILGTNYHEEQKFDIMKEAAKNQAGGGLAELSASLGISKPTNIVEDDYRPGEESDSLSVKCYDCGAENKASSKFCNKCGAKLTAMACPNCGSPIKLGMKFCNECGASLSIERVCPDCGSKVPSGAKFCNECGKKME